LGAGFTAGLAATGAAAFAAGLVFAPLFEAPDGAGGTLVAVFAPGAGLLLAGVLVAGVLVALEVGMLWITEGGGARA
jgi:hypothetical protein